MIVHMTRSHKLSCDMVMAIRIKVETNLKKTYIKIVDLKNKPCADKYFVQNVQLMLYVDPINQHIKNYKV